MATLRPRYFGADNLRKGGVVLAGADTASDVVGKGNIIVTSIPIEVIGFYQAIISYFGTSRADWFWWGIVGGVLVTGLWVAFATQDFGSERPQPKTRVAWRQTILACWAFICWSIGTVTPELGQQIGSGWWNSAFGPAALAFGAVTLPILDGVLQRVGIPQDPVRA